MYRDVTMADRDGPHTGECEYALTKFAPEAASLRRAGISTNVLYLVLGSRIRPSMESLDKKRTLYRVAALELHTCNRFH